MHSLPFESLDNLPPMCAAILDSSYNGIVIINHCGVVVFYNQSALRMIRFAGSSPVGRHFSEVLPETWPDMKKVLETGLPQIGRRIILPQATIIANRNPIKANGKVVGVISVFQDISQYENIISELQGHKKLHRELEAVFESFYDGLYITDGKANTIRVNSAYERITGLSRQELIGRNMEDLVAEKVFDHSVTLEVLKSRTQLTLMQSVKGNKQVMVTGTPIFDESGEIVIVVTNMRDMTLLNRLRSELEESRRLSSRYYQSILEQEKFEHALQEIVIKSTAMTQVVQKIVKVSGVDISVLLYGESGVGKSMLARIIHLMSSRKERPFVKINCGTIPESLMESELFGYSRGAFTGAAREGKAGLIEAGHTGTVFLDEVGDLTPAMQVKLLQVLEEKTFTRIGETRPTSVDVRIIAATNRDLKERVRTGRFREDLYYRLNVIPVYVPPLRDRTEDVPALAVNILEKFRRTMGLHKRMEPEVLDGLMRYHYPGNVRELINLMERMIVMSEGDVITAADLPGELKEAPPLRGEPLETICTLKESVAAVETRMIAGALRCHRSLGLAARTLGVHPTTLWRKMVRYGLAGGKQGSNDIAFMQ
ncbi:MAG: sigma 54-interacting transcriptional regulator [Deltaproteobacteria bacterium]|nr:sigma 54-interacting transcriptional regulator [Deltaproteobacteria bacterium]